MTEISNVFNLVKKNTGGWNPTPPPNTPLSEIFKSDINEEVDQAFANVDIALKHAGGKGWSQVYSVMTYSTDIQAQHERIVENLKKWMPNHHAVWTELGVKELGGGPAMRIEIKVEAYDPQQEKKE